jgi:hypothetical protein
MIANIKLNDSCYPEFNMEPVGARLLFIDSLRIRWPLLWKKLNRDVWRAHPRPDLIQWASRQGITDPWLIDVFAQTIRYWDHRPNTPDARLEKSARWYFYFPDGRSPEDLAKFQPKLDKPWPLVEGGGEMYRLVQLAVPLTRSYQEFERLMMLALVQPLDLKSESLQEFKRRMMKQFREQLTDWVSRRRKFMMDSERWKAAHAEWTALVLGGISIAEIARQPDWSQVLRRGEPEATVGMAVARFAKRIKLTLPRRRLTLENNTLGTRDQKAPVNSTNGQHSDLPATN